MKTAFILIANGNLNFEPRYDRGNNRRQRQHHYDDVKICFMHTFNFSIGCASISDHSNAIDARPEKRRLGSRDAGSLTQKCTLIFFRPG